MLVYINTVNIIRCSTNKFSKSTLDSAIYDVFKYIRAQLFVHYNKINQLVFRKLYNNTQLDN